MRQLWNANMHYHGLVLASLPKGASRVLDVGCGDGILAAQLFESGVPNVVALDVDQPVLDRARARHEGMPIEWLQGDVLDASLEPQSFDAVVGADVLAAAADVSRNESAQ